VTTSARSHEALTEFSRTRTSMALWFGMLGGPAAGFLNILINYRAVERACVMDSSLVIHVLTILFLAVAVLAGLTSWRLRQRAGRWPDNAGGMLARSRFMTTVGVLTSAIAIVGIVMQWIPVFFLGACHGT
jgi:heme/copper-type cytochrome/quinol oxidase subunit 2